MELRKCINEDIRGCPNGVHQVILLHTLMYAYSATETLGDTDDHESAAAWVQKLKAIQEEKEKAERRVISSV